MICVDADGAPCRWWRRTHDLEKLDQTFWEVLDEEFAERAQRARERLALLQS